ncbi:MAG: LacI family DNA-binding transcriptional regulator [Chloroflexota bacterium]
MSGRANNGTQHTTRNTQHESRRVTSIDVAEVAGVSQSTVSRTFSGASVSPAARARVMAAAAQLGYSPNALARSLSTQRSRIIGVVIGGMSSPYNPYVLEIFSQRLQEMNQQILFFNVPPDEDVDALIPIVLQYQVDALIIMAATVSSEMAKVCANQGTPVLLFNRTSPDTPVHTVCTDNLHGGQLAADLFVDTGHRRMAYVSGPANTSTSREREAGFVQQLVKRDCPLVLREECNHSHESAFAAGRRLLQHEHPPDAIFCASDIIAIGIIDQIRKRNLRVPEDVSIIGFDDIPAASWSAYDLTTIRLPVNRMVDASLKLLAEEYHTPQTILIPGTMIERRTVRPKMQS